MPRIEKLQLARKTEQLPRLGPEDDDQDEESPDTPTDEPPPVPIQDPPDEDTPAPPMVVTWGERVC